MVWVNADGLRVKFGVEEGTPARVTEYKSDGPRRFVEIVLDADFLPAGGSIVFDEYTLPSNAKIETLSTAPASEDFADGTSIAVSGVDKDGTSNVVAFGAAITTAELNAAVDVQDLEVQLTAEKYIRLTTVGTFSAGKSTLRLFWSVPKEETDTLVWDKTGA